MLGIGGGSIIVRGLLMSCVFGSIVPGVHLFSVYLGVEIVQGWLSRVGR